MRVTKFFNWKNRSFIDYAVNKLYPIEKIGRCIINGNKTIINQRPRQEATSMIIKFKSRTETCYVYLKWIGGEGVHARF